MKRAAILVVVTMAVLGGCATKQPRTWEECQAVFFEGIPTERITMSEYGSQDVPLLRPGQAKDEVFGLVVTENRVPVVALRINYFKTGEIFKIEAVIDGACQNVRTWENAYTPGEKVLQNWDAVAVTVDDIVYVIRLGDTGDGEIRATLAGGA